MPPSSLPAPARLRATAPHPAPWRRAVLTLAALGAAWNLFGIGQLAGTLTGDVESLMAGGMTSAQAAAYLALPAWMNLAFAMGVFGGLAGSLALAWRRRAALPLLATSMAAYMALFAGDVQQGLFDILPRQLPVLLAVLAVAAVLLAAAIASRRAGGLR